MKIPFKFVAARKVNDDQNTMLKRASYKKQVHLSPKFNSSGKTYSERGIGSLVESKCSTISIYLLLLVVVICYLPLLLLQASCCVAFGQINRKKPSRVSGECGPLKKG